jgi:enamine deaminase RidA (YjgF/YER057c/UK114 family)
MNAIKPPTQSKTAMRCVKLLLEEVGARMEDICKVTTYLTERSYRDQVYAVLARHLKGVNPVSTGLVVKALALPEMDFEIDVFAVIPDERDLGTRP